jgi:hypothetical protein
MTDPQALFPETYEASRDRFRGNLSAVRSLWPKAELHHHVMSYDDNLTIDWIKAHALEKNEKVFVLTTAEHGVEGYVGSAMLQLFVEKFMPGFDPRNTGILLLHTINPWGMKNHRRGNKDNVDLNRTFMLDAKFDPAFNPDYDKISTFLSPPSKLTNLFFSDLFYMLQLGKNIFKLGMRNFRYALLLGQYRHQKGLYYGGTEMPEETKVLMGLYRNMFESFEQILHLDMHTGYGPRYQMSLVNSALEKGNSEHFSKRFNYPLVVAATADEFYAIRGDMIDYEYALWQRDFSNKRYFGTAFEFGTLGDLMYGLFQSPRVMIHENRAYWYGAQNEKLHKKAKSGFEELFHPSAKDWREKAVADSQQAFSGILRAEGYLK